MQITWPSPQEYNEVIQNPRLAFKDPELQEGSPELNQLGLPRPTTGSFACVYQMLCSHKSWAVRCFLKSAYNQELRYERISEHLKQSKLLSMVSFEYQAEGIKFRGRHLPIIKMEWIDGVTMDNFVRVAYQNADTMLILAKQFFDLYTELQNSSIAHGDLQHGNLLVTNRQLRLIDYDDMYIPSLNANTSNELGHRNYQHPLRTSRNFGPYLDNFSAWVILVSLYVLSIDSSIWQALSGGEECLLFRQADFRSPYESHAFNLLTNHSNHEINELVLFLRDLIGQSIESITPPTQQAFPRLAGPLTGDLLTYVNLAKEKSARRGDGNKASEQREAKNQDANTSFSQISSLKAPTDLKKINQVFANGNYSDAAFYYWKMLANYKNQASGTAAEARVQIECMLQLGYCYIFLGRMDDALLQFNNGLFWASQKISLI